MSTVTSSSADEPIQPFKFKSVKDIFDAPAEQVEYCVEGLLPSSGLSVLAGKPKAGKTTLARQLAVAVAQGEPFLGRVTDQGSVLYFAIEEKQSEVAAHFRLLGLNETDPVHIVCGSVPKGEALAMLKASLQSMPDVRLVIIDPVFRFVGVKDGNDYVQVSNAFEPLLEIARNFRVHLLIVHHQKKRETEDVMDGALGSTAITAAVDSYLALSVTAGRVRTLLSRQRYGLDMEPTRLNWNSETRQLSLGLTCDEAAQLEATETRKRVEIDTIHYVVEHEGCTQQAIFAAVHGKTGLKKEVLQRLTDDGTFVKSGEGAKGDPYTYKWREMPTAPRLEFT